jgi:hypothetical protein
MMTQDFKADFFEVMRLIKESQSLALARFADGEANILKNNTIGNKDGWLYKRDKNLVFRRDLRKSLLCTDPGYLYGISCTCCDEVNHDFLLKNLLTEKKHLTFSNIFVNANFSLFNERFFPTLREAQKRIVLCTGEKAKLRNIQPFLTIADFIPVPGNCVVWWEKNRDFIKGLLDLKGSTYRDAVFLFAAGPLSEILIHELWQVNRSNVYLDIGSTLDKYLFNRESRVYHRPNNEFSLRECRW